MKSRAKKSSSASASTEAVHAALEWAAVDAGEAEHIATAAYFKAQARGFSPGREIDDWLEAENEYRQQLTSQGAQP